MSVLRNVAAALRDRVERQEGPGNAQNGPQERLNHCPGCDCLAPESQAATEPSTAEEVTDE